MSIKSELYAYKSPDSFFKIRQKDVEYAPFPFLLAALSFYSEGANRKLTVTIVSSLTSLKFTEAKGKLAVDVSHLNAKPASADSLKSRLYL